MNIILRLKNKTTLAALVSALVVFAYSCASALGLSLPVEQDTVMSAVAAVLTLLTGLGVLVDPTTKGIADSADAMGYTAPREDGDDLPDEADEVSFGEEE